MTVARNMSFADIQKRIQEMDDERAELELALQAKRGEELKVLADAYAKKLEAAGFSIAEGNSALDPYDKSEAKRTRSPNGSRASEAKAYVKGTVYKDPNSSATWTGGTKGRQPPWLIAALEGAPDKIKAYEKLAAGGDHVNNG